MRRTALRLLAPALPVALLFACGDEPSDRFDGATFDPDATAADAGGDDVFVPVEICTNYADDDGDGLIDCDDPDCDRVDCEDRCPDVDLGEAWGMAVWVGTTENAGHRLTGTCGGQAGDDIALLWTAPWTDTYTFDTRGSEIDTVLYLTAETCEGVEIACNDDFDTRTLQSGIAHPLDAGDSVVIVIDGWEVIGGPSGGPVRLNITPDTLEDETRFCGNGLDDDDDGVADCLDDDCADVAACQPLDDIVFVGAGPVSSLAIDSEGGGWAWGTGDQGSTGVEGGGRAKRPRAIAVDAPLVAADFGQNHGCALDADGGVWCFGANWNGQLGLGDTEARDMPERLTSVSSGSMLATGAYHSCVVFGEGNVACWGNNGQGQLGRDPGTTVLEPRTVSGLADVAQVVTGDNHTCTRSDDGVVHCFGYGGSGQLGAGNQANRSDPFEVPLDAPAVDVCAGNQFTCTALDDGSAWCWGQNYQGQIDGSGGRSNVLDPQRLTGDATIVDVACGSGHVCTLDDGGTVRCQGLNNQGQLGRETTQNPARMGRVDGITAAAIVAGASHTCALLGDGTVACFGANTSGQIGDDTLLNRFEPTRVLAEETVADAP